MKSHTFTVGSVHRREFMIRLDELGLPYKEHRTPFNSTIIVQTFLEAHDDAYSRFELDVSNFVLRLDAVKQQRELEALRKEHQKKVARKNFFRRLTFRKPLK